MLFTALTSASETLKTLAALSHVVLATFLRHGLPLNFKTGKSEGNVVLRGQGSAAAKVSLIIEDDAGMQLSVPGFPDVTLAIVASNKHMGGLLLPSCAMELEIKYRCASMYDKFVPMRCNVFRNGNVPTKTRTSLAESLMHTHLLYNSATWSILKIHEMRKLQRAFLAPYRAIHDMVNLTDEQHYSDVHVYSAAGASSIGIVLRLNRLRYLARLLNAGPQILVHMILLQVKSKNSWITIIINDLFEAWSRAGNMFSSMPDPKIDISKWLCSIAEPPTHWNTSFKKAFACEHFSPSVSNDLFGMICTSEARTVSPTGFFVCDACECFFSDHVAYFSHQAKMHGYRNPLRYKVCTVNCLACNTVFHSIQRVFRYVAYKSSSCRQYYISNVPDLSEEECVAVAALDYYNDSKSSATKKLKRPAIKIII